MIAYNVAAISVPLGWLLSSHSVINNAWLTRLLVRSLIRTRYRQSSWQTIFARTRQYPAHHERSGTVSCGLQTSFTRTEEKYYNTHVSSGRFKNIDRANPAILKWMRNENQKTEQKKTVQLKGQLKKGFPSIGQFLICRALNNSQNSYRSRFWRLVT